MDTSVAYRTPLGRSVRFRTVAATITGGNLCFGDPTRNDTAPWRELTLSRLDRFIPMSHAARQTTRCPFQGRSTYDVVAEQVSTIAVEKYLGECSGTRLWAMEDSAASGSQSHSIALDGWRAACPSRSVHEGSDPPFNARMREGLKPMMGNFYAEGRRRSLPSAAAQRSNA